MTTATSPAVPEAPELTVGDALALEHAWIALVMLARAAPSVDPASVTTLRHLLETCEVDADEPGRVRHLRRPVVGTIRDENGHAITLGGLPLQGDIAEALAARTLQRVLEHLAREHLADATWEQIIHPLSNLVAELRRRANRSLLELAKTRRDRKRRGW